jgi:hypothetical protein
MALWDFLKDDKGMLQGGAEGRAFGRGRDFLESEPTENLSGWRDESTRQMGRDFDVNDNESVLKLQQHMNYQNRDNPNYTQLAEDGMFGGKTEAALRYTQQGGSPNTNQIETTPDGSLNTATTQVANQINQAGGDGSSYVENRANNQSVEGYRPTFGFGQGEEGPENPLAPFADAFMNWK